MGRGTIQSWNTDARWYCTQSTTIFCNATKQFIDVTHTVQTDCVSDVRLYTQFLRSESINSDGMKKKRFLFLFFDDIPTAELNRSDIYRLISTRKMAHRWLTNTPFTSCVNSPRKIVFKHHQHHQMDKWFHWFAAWLCGTFNSPFSYGFTIATQPTWSNCMTWLSISYHGGR